MSNPPADARDRQDFVWHVHAYLNDQIKFADTKAAFVAALATGVTGALYGAHVHEHFTGPAGAGRLWPGGVAAAAFGLLIFSLVTCLASIVPRRRSFQPRGYIYWGAIAEHDSQETYYRQLQSETADALTEHLGHHAYTLATICKDKYRWLTWAIVSLVAGGVIGGALLLWAPVAASAVK